MADALAALARTMFREIEKRMAGQKGFDLANMWNSLIDEDILRRHLQLLADLREMGLKQKVGEPWHDLLGAVASDTQGHGERKREGGGALLPCGVIGERQAILICQAGNGPVLVVDRRHGSTRSGKAWQVAEIVVGRLGGRGRREFQVTEIDADRTGGDQRFFQMAARLAVLQVDDEALAGAASLGQLNLSPAQCLATLSDQSSKFCSRSDHDTLHTIRLTVQEETDEIQKILPIGKVRYF